MMKPHCILLVIGSLLLVVAQHEAHASNYEYFLSLLGIKHEVNQANRNLVHNYVAHERIRNKRLRRREDRQWDAQADRAQKIATTAQIVDVGLQPNSVVLEETSTPKEDDVSENTGKKRTKKHAKKRQKEEHYEKRVEKKEAKAAAVQSESGTVVGDKKTKSVQAYSLTEPTDSVSDRGDKSNTAETMSQQEAPLPVETTTTENTRKKRRKHAAKRQKEEHYEKRAEKKAEKQMVAMESEYEDESNTEKKTTDNKKAEAYALTESTQSKTKNGNIEHDKVVRYTSDTVEVSSRNGEGGTTTILSVAEPSVSNTGEEKESSHERLAHKRQNEHHYEKKVENHLAKKAEKIAAVSSSGSNHKNKEHAKGRQDERNREKRAELKQKHSLAMSDRTNVYVPENTIPFIPFTPDALETLESMEQLPVVALYWGIFNNPEACSQQLCTLSDAFNPETEASILHGAGAVPDRDGNVVLTSSLYRTPKTTNNDGLTEKTNETMSSPGFYNTDAAIVIGIRTSPLTETGTMDQMLALTKAINVLDDLTGFVQYASFQLGETGFGELFDFQTGQIVRNKSLVHLTRQNDMIQVYLDTNVAE